MYFCAGNDKEAMKEGHLLNGNYFKDTVYKQNIFPFLRNQTNIADPGDVRVLRGLDIG